MRFSRLAACFFLVCGSAPAFCQPPGRPPRGGGRPPMRQARQPSVDAPKADQVVTQEPAAIQWFATLSRGLEEAERTGKPILFVSGNPSCAGVSGMWCPGKGKIDSTYLHQPEVIEASKNFVCIRLTAYEDESERQFMSKLVMGQVSNTAFAILKPDGTPAVKNKGTGKGPGGLFIDGAEMAKGMDRIAANYKPKEVEGTPALPITLNAKVGMVVAAADNQPLALVIAQSEQRRKELEEHLAKVAWSDPIRGRFVYASAERMQELAKVDGEALTDGYVLIEPDMFGSGGKIIRAIPGDTDIEGISTAMSEASKNFVPFDKSRQKLAELGLKNGIFYETGIPVSGPGEAADRERYFERLKSTGK